MTHYRIIERHKFLLWEAERPPSFDAETLLMASVCAWVQQLSFHNSISSVDNLLEAPTTLIDPFPTIPKTVEQIYYQLSQNGSRHLPKQKNSRIQSERTGNLWYCSGLSRDLAASRACGGLIRNTEFIYLFIYVTTQENNGQLQRKHKYKKEKETNLNRNRKAQDKTETNLMFC